LSDDTLLRRGNEHMLMLGNPTQQQNKLAGKQMTVTALPLEPLRPEPAPEVERILMVDFTTTYAWAKGAAPSANFEVWGGRLGPL
jgi:hypothetical protein